MIPLYIGSRDSILHTFWEQNQWLEKWLDKTTKSKHEKDSVGQIWFDQRSF